jgi:EAL domain-containing protein (putative c-di-GMP-specific phosphodiesterase class I)
MVKNEFEMFYQPIQNVQTPTKIHLESLLRWHHPEKGLLTPGYFLDIVENNGQIIEISRLMFEKICSFLEQKKKEGFYIDSISFNLCVASLRLQNEADFFIQTMKDHYVLPSQIVIEITESLFFENKFEVNQNLKMFREFGIEVAIDDFGMEYSTLSMLENVEYDVIKLDQHFTKNLGTKNADLVVNMIHELCVFNNKRCIVEGVEEKEQLDSLLERGFVEFQGYYYARPMLGSKLEEYYSKNFAKKKRLI